MLNLIPAVLECFQMRKQTKNGSTVEVLVLVLNLCDPRARVPGHHTGLLHNLKSETFTSGYDVKTSESKTADNMSWSSMVTPIFSVSLP